jgi:hypothetical protein
MLSPQEAFAQALTYFGRGGQGLELTSKDDFSLVFHGGGGYVAVTVQPGAKTTLDIETREWDYAVRQFMADVH